MVGCCLKFIYPYFCCLMIMLFYRFGHLLDMRPSFIIRVLHCLNVYFIFFWSAPPKAPTSHIVTHIWQFAWFEIVFTLHHPCASLHECVYSVLNTHLKSPSTSNNETPCNCESWYIPCNNPFYTVPPSNNPFLGLLKSSFFWDFYFGQTTAHTDV